MSPIATPTADAIARAAERLRTGGLVAFPTETVYGLGANAFDERAVARVFEVKGRPHFDPLIVHVSGAECVPQLVIGFPAAAKKLAERFWPGPLTLVLPKAGIVPDLVTAGCPTVAVRVPDHSVARALLREAGCPVAAPSANLFGRISPTTAEHVREQLGEAVDLILDGGPCRVGVESTVLRIVDDRVLLLRPGGVTLEELEAVIGPVATAHGPQQPAEEAGLVSPGTLPQHYAPRTPLVVQEVRSAECGVRSGGGGVGLLAFREPADASGFVAVEVLSAGGDLREAAARFFAALRRLDAAGLELIVAEPLPEQGLGRALNDRLRRAAHA